MVEEKFFLGGTHLFPAACPNCGGLLGAPEGGRVKCGYCGSEFRTQDFFKTAAGVVKDFYEKAYNAQEEGNFEEAYEYFSKVLEIAPTEYLAWFGKGTAAGRLSTSHEIRSSEVIYCFEKAIIYAPEKNKEDIERTLGATAGEIGTEILDRLRITTTSSDDLAQILELLKYWDAKDPENEICWKWLVRLGETPAGKVGNYPHWRVAREYSKKIREMFDPAFSYDSNVNPYVSNWGAAIVIIIIVILIVLIIYFLVSVF